MKQVSVVISTYTSDVSGVCSALYELGGMVVIHDPSGCNSTYNTHDEPRWFSKDSLIFISGLSQMDAVMGNDEKFIDDILRAAEELHPRFIALVRSPIPLMIGTDFEGISWEIEQRCGIPTFFIPTTGMKSYVRGAGMAFETFVHRFLPERKPETFTEEDFDKKDFHQKGSKKDSIKVNILGATPLDLSVNETFDSLKKYIEESGFLWNGSLAFETDFESVMHLPEGDVNLVISANGLLAAKAMQERYGIPYVTGFPVGCLRQRIRDAIKEAAQTGKNILVIEKFKEGFYRKSFRKTEKDQGTECKESNGGNKNDFEITTMGFLIHEPVIALSISEAISHAFSVTVKPLTMLEPIKELEGTGLEWIASEEEMKERLEDGDFVIADPMFQPICKKGVPFYPLPHEAFSGRIYRKEIPNLVEMLGEN